MKEVFLLAEILRGKDVAQAIKDEIVIDVEKLKKDGIKPTMGIVRLGSNPDDVSYEKSIIKNCEKLGIGTQVFENSLEMSTEELEDLLKSLNNDNSISGILVFRPLPKHIDEARIRKAISPDKDVDCMHPLNLARVFEGDMDGFVPCTPKSAMEILLQNNVNLEGKNVVIVNRSMVLGKPLTMMMLNENATVTICHSRTKDLPSITKAADVVVTALGKAKFFDEKYFNQNSICIDVGVSVDENGKLSGDIDYEPVSKLVKMITPVPGGVGSVTTSLLLSQVIKASKLSQ